MATVNPKPDMAETEDRIKTSSLNKILRLAEDHPERTLEVPGGWLHQPVSV